ncbi:MAG: DUF2892 domain-containing protein [Candidatus Nanohaloarchaea archaeon]
MADDTGAIQLVLLLLGAVSGLVSLAQLASIGPVTSLPMILSPVLGVLALVLLYVGFTGEYLPE